MKNGDISDRKHKCIPDNTSSRLCISSSVCTDQSSASTSSCVVGKFIVFIQVHSSREHAFDMCDGIVPCTSSSRRRMFGAHFRRWSHPVFHNHKMTLWCIFSFRHHRAESLQTCRTDIFVAIITQHGSEKGCYRSRDREQDSKSLRIIRFVNLMSISVERVTILAQSPSRIFVSFKTRRRLGYVTRKNSWSEPVGYHLKCLNVFLRITVYWE